MAFNSTVSSVTNIIASTDWPVVNITASEVMNLTASLCKKCLHESVDCVTTIFENSETTVQILRRRNGTNYVVAEVASEFLAGTFFAFLAVCLLICFVYISVVFYVKLHQKRSFMSALKTVREEIDSVKVPSARPNTPIVV